MPEYKPCLLCGEEIQVTLWDSQRGVCVPFCKPNPRESVCATVESGNMDKTSPEESRSENSLFKSRAPRLNSERNSERAGSREPGKNSEKNARECSRCGACFEGRKGVKMVQGKLVCHVCMTQAELVETARAFLARRERWMAQHNFSISEVYDDSERDELTGVTFTAADVFRGWRKYARFGKPASFLLCSQREWLDQQALNGQPGRADFEIVALQYAHMECFFIDRPRWGPVRFAVRDDSLEDRSEFDQEFVSWYVEHPLRYFPEVRDMLVHSWEDLLPVVFEEVNADREVSIDTLHTWRRRGVLDCWQFEGRWYTTSFFVNLRLGVSKKGGSRKNAGRKKKVESFDESLE